MKEIILESAVKSSAPVAFWRIRGYDLYMKRRLAIGVVAVLLALYALAGLHQFLSHHAEHGSCDTCPLCVLLTTPSLLAAAPVIQSISPVVAVAMPAHVLAMVSAPRGVLLLRGPPSV
jgi:hypothetical protein